MSSNDEENDEGREDITEVEYAEGDRPSLPVLYIHMSIHPSIPPTRRLAHPTHDGVRTGKRPGKQTRGWRERKDVRCRHVVMSHVRLTFFSYGGIGFFLSLVRFPTYIFFSVSLPDGVFQPWGCRFQSVGCRFCFWDDGLSVLTHSIESLPVGIEKKRKITKSRRRRDVQRTKGRRNTSPRILCMSRLRFRRSTMGYSPSHTNENKEISIHHPCMALNHGKQTSSGRRE